MKTKDRKQFFLISATIVLLSIVSQLPFGILNFLSNALLVSVLGTAVVLFHYGYTTFLYALAFVVTLIFRQSFAGALITLLPIMLCGLSVGIAYNVKMPALKTCCLLTVVYVFSITANLKLAGNMLPGQNLYENLISTMNTVMTDALTNGKLPGMSPNEIKSTVQEITAQMMKLLPSVLIIGSSAFSLCSMCFFKRILQRIQIDTSSIAPFTEWNGDKTIGYVYLVLLCVLFVVKSNTFTRDILWNIVLVGAFFFFVLGLGILEKKLSARIRSHRVVRGISLVTMGICTVTMGLPFFILSTAGVIKNIFARAK